MRTNFANSFGPASFLNMLCKMQHLEHQRQELLYLQAYGTAQSEYKIPPAPCFSSYNDCAWYAGTHPSTFYCKSIFTVWMCTFCVLYNCIMAALLGEILRGDHTFLVSRSFVSYIQLYIDVMSRWRSNLHNLVDRVRTLPCIYLSIRTSKFVIRHSLWQRR